MLTRIKLGQFRCFDHFETEFHPGTNLILGRNAVGKTSLLEAACVLLRLQSPRASRLGDVIRHGQKGLLVDGFYSGIHLQFYYGTRRKKLALDSVEQTNAAEYLKVARVVWFSNTDIRLIRDAADVRRRFLDFLAIQIEPGYRAALRSYERALRSRNLLLKAPVPSRKQIRAFDGPLVEAGEHLGAVRETVVASLRPLAQLAHRAISGSRETLDIQYQPSVTGSFAGELEQARGEELRLRQTLVGPHRDELCLLLAGQPATFGSEGQQRTLALSLRLGAARLLEAQGGRPPLLLLDDIFGELDRERRAALLKELPASSQQIITTTQLEWLPSGLDAHTVRIEREPEAGSGARQAADAADAQGGEAP
jgi:DNA replication and repair protein RecF